WTGFGASGRARPRSAIRIPHATSHSARNPRRNGLRATITANLTPFRGDSFPHRLDFGMLEPEELRDPPRELAFHRGQIAVGVDDSPDRLDQPQPLLPGKALGHELRELIEIHAFLAGFLREPQ